MYYFILIMVMGIVGFLLYNIYGKNDDLTTANSSKGITPETILYLRKRKYTTYFCVAGVQYYDYHIAARKRLFRDDTLITLKRQPKNRKDTNAIEVYFADIKVGYVPRYEASILAPQFDNNDKFTAYLEQYNARKYYDDRIEIELVNETLRESIEGI
jgi:hypothetical protein